MNFTEKTKAEYVATPIASDEIGYCTDTFEIVYNSTHSGAMTFTKDGNEMPPEAVEYQAIIKNSDRDGDVRWGWVLPETGTDNQVLKKTGNNYPDYQWETIYEVPTNGSTNQQLEKTGTGATDYAWVTNYHIPIDGTSGQFLKKTGTGATDYAWESASTSYEVPTDGTSGQQLEKTGTGATDYAWVSNYHVPTDGTSGQHLKKTGTGATDYAWVTDTVDLSSYFAKDSAGQTGVLYCGNVECADVDFNGGILQASYSSTSNIDHVWYDDSDTGGAGLGAWHFCADTSRKATGNAGIYGGQITLSATPTTTTAANVNISAGQIRTVTSLRSFKTDIQDYQYGLDIALLLKPVKFNSNLELCPEDDNTYLKTGFIAEDVEIIDQGLCQYDKGELSGVQYERMGAVAISAIQELNEKIEMLMQRIEELEAK